MLMFPFLSLASLSIVLINLPIPAIKYVYFSIISLFFVVLKSEEKERVMTSQTDAFPNFFQSVVRRLQWKIVEETRNQATLQERLEEIKSSVYVFFFFGIPKTKKVLQCLSHQKIDNEIQGVTKLNTGTEQNKPEYSGMRRNNTGMKRNEQEWCQNIPEHAGMTPG